MSTGKKRRDAEAGTEGEEGEIASPIPSGPRPSRGVHSSRRCQEPCVYTQSR